MFDNVRKKLLNATFNKVAEDTNLNPDIPFSDVSFSNVDFKAKLNGDVEITLSLKATTNIYALARFLEENKDKL